MPNSPDDLAALKAERAAADREYNDALTRLDRAIQQLGYVLQLTQLRTLMARIGADQRRAAQDRGLELLLARRVRTNSGNVRSR